MSKINQSENFNSDFGYCLRSSSIFYLPPFPIKTKIILSNYWFFKNNINVFILASFRNMKGKLIKREELKFKNKNVIEIDSQNIVGSCEIEAFSSVDLKIPYSAIMVVYETAKSISMVHSYSRLYSSLEIEDKKTITDGHEGCWVLKDNNKVESFGVLHNGSKLQKKQKMTFVFENFKGTKKKISFNHDPIKPYETVLIKPSNYFENIKDFLQGKDGTCSFHFELSNSFTRMLIGWNTNDFSQMQVTHSNFDYSAHETDFVKDEHNTAYMTIPKIDNHKLNVLIYPDRSPGNYLLKSSVLKKINIPKKLYSFESNTQVLEFKREDGKLPSRIVTGIKLESKNKNVLAAECSLGVYHFKVPPKRFHWGLCSAKYNSNLFITAIKDIFGDPFSASICLRLYTQKSVQINEKIINWKDISHDNLNGKIEIKKIFDKSFIDYENYMYVSLFSKYGGFFAYTTLVKGQSISLEHTF